MNDQGQTGNDAAADSRIAYVVLNYNGLDDTLECLQSLDTARDSRTDVIVVDNASSVSPEDAIRDRYPWVHLVLNDKNRGWSGGNNSGIQRALELGARWIVLLNNDTTVSDSMVKRHWTVTQQEPDLAVYGPLINEYDEPEQLQTSVCWFNRQDADAFFSSESIDSQAINQYDRALILDTDIVNGCCMIIRRDVFEEIGMIDDAFFLIHEESDFCLRAKQAGFRLGVLAEAHIWHKHSVSFQRAGKPLQRYYGTRNLGLLLRKHAKRPKSRNRISSKIQYYRHAYHVYCHERELQNPAGAEAVLEGMSDFWSRRFGVRAERSRWQMPMLRAFFASTWRLCGSASGAATSKK
ncbi:MAG: glycosyltransferase family 2 protein [Planctomycetota bacterium]